MGGIKITIGLGYKRLLRDIKKVTRKLTGMGKGIGRIGLRMGRSLARGLMRGAAAGAAGLAGVIGKSLGESGKFERFEFQFKSLLGSADAAKKRIDEMKDLDLEVDAELGDLINASRILTVFTNNMHAGKDAMRMMADAAAVTPNNIQDIAFWYGRAYSMIQSGRPFGEASMRLQEMGLMSGEARNEIERLSTGAGRMANIGKILEVLNGEFLKFEGAALRNAKTWTGMMSIMRSATSQAFAAMGDAMMPLAKVWLQELIDKITELRNNGTLEGWGTTISDEFKKVRTYIETELVPAFITLKDQIARTLKDGKLDNVLAAQLEKGAENGAKFAIAKLKTYLPSFISVGSEIGNALLNGMQREFYKNMPKWLKKQIDFTGLFIPEIMTQEKLNAKRDARRKELSNRPMINVMGSLGAGGYPGFAADRDRVDAMQKRISAEIHNEANPLPVSVIRNKDKSGHQD